MSKRRPARRRAPIVVVLALASALLAPGAAAQDPAIPVLAYWTTTNAVVADGDGNALRTFPDFRKMSLGGSVLAAEIPGSKPFQARVVAIDALTGDRLFRIRDARLPVVLNEGKKVAFFPTSERDSYGMSVWMRMASGHVRKIAQFKARGLPGIPHGMGGDMSPLDIAFDGRGRMMALVGGLETIRDFDVWLVDTKTKEVTRVTRGLNSHNPSLTPSGSSLAVRVESTEACPDPLYGEILIGKIKIVDLASGERRDITSFDCDLFYDTPRWIDERTLVATRATKDPTEVYGYDLDLVTFDIETQEWTDLVTEGNPCCATTSPSLGRIAYVFSDRDGFALLDVATGTTVDFSGEVFAPHLGGESRF